MADRIIRDELLTSERWLDLPTDAARLAFVGFVLICDDFGNFEGGVRRLFRFLRSFTQIETEDAAVSAIDALMVCDLIRRYPVDNREFFHIPRFKSHRQYLSRHYPPSPWCRDISELGKDKRIFNKGLAKNIVATSLLRSSDVAEGVGVGVGEVQKEGLSISPTRGQEVKVKNVYKKFPDPPTQEQLERNRRVGLAVAQGNLELAREIREGRA